MTPYTIAPARYAKDMMAVHCNGDGTGYKDRAQRLASYFARDRYSNRDHAYIMSPTAAKKFDQHYRDGFDASFFTRELWPPNVETTP